MSELVRITREDLADRRVDAVLERQLAFKTIAGRARVGALRRFLLSSTFYTALVGAMGGCIGWALIEPHFSDAETLQGVVKASHPDRTLAGCPRCGKIRSIDGGPAGKMVCPACGSGLSLPAGTPVRGMWSLEREDLYAAPGKTRIVRRGEAGILSSAAEIESGSTIRAIACLPDDQDLFDRPSAIVLQVEVDVPLSPKDGNPDFASLARRNRWSGILFFAVVGGMIALMVGAVEGILSLNILQSLLCGGMGLAVGFAGGLVGILPAGMIYSVCGEITSSLAGPGGFLTIRDLSGAPLFAQIVGRSLAWGAVGLSLALGQGIARRSKTMVLQGLIGGCLGGLMGGLIFDPLAKLTGTEGAELSRMLGLSAVGAMIGLLIGAVEQMAKEAWLILRTGPLAGKQFVLHDSVTNAGSSPRCHIYLFRDVGVMEEHVRFTRFGRTHQIESSGGTGRTLVNGVPAEKRILRDGDRITIGSTELEYRSRTC
jgi:hypothetical protein